MKKFILILALFLGACTSNQTPQYAYTPNQYQNQNCTYYPARGGYWVYCNGQWFWE